LIICETIEYIYNNVRLTLFAGKRILGIAIDPCQNTLYYTDMNKRSINMVTLRTGKKKKIVSTDKLEPLGLALELNAR